ncbi:MAG: hypothetical protein CBC48_02895 [bacterium TMED88]|nr:hypothetical protein [Deltaproteobacteria bacterium]OUV35955.1 MAG: hypothetical protein CBC48_02895 [bacterium TMED88]
MGLLRRAKRGSGHKTPDASTLWARALGAALSDDLEGADSALTSLVEQGTQRPEVYKLLGRVARERGNFQRALQIHQALVLRRDLSASHRVESLNELGHSLEALGELDRALAAHQEVLVHARHNPIALESAERLLSDRGDFESAWVMRRRRGRVEGFRDRRGEAELLCAIADSSLGSGERRRGIRTMGRALRVAPDFAEAWKLKARHAKRTRQRLKSWARWLEAERVPSPDDLVEAEAAFSRADRISDWVNGLQAQARKYPGESVLWRFLGRALALSESVESGPVVRDLVAGLSDPAAGVRGIRNALSESEADEEDVISQYCDWIDRWQSAAQRDEPQVKGD